MTVLQLIASPCDHMVDHLHSILMRGISKPRVIQHVIKRLEGKGDIHRNSEKLRFSQVVYEYSNLIVIGMQASSNMKAFSSFLEGHPTSESEGNVVRWPNENQVKGRSSFYCFFFWKFERCRYLKKAVIAPFNHAVAELKGIISKLYIMLLSANVIVWHWVQASPISEKF